MTPTIIIPKNYLRLELKPDFEVVVSFQDHEPIKWDLSELKKLKYDPKDYDLFKEINSFLQTQPIPVSEHLYEYYRRIHASVHSTKMSIDSKMKTLIRDVAGLLSVVDLNALHDWVLLQRDISIPSGFHDSYQYNSIQSLDDFEISDPSKAYTPSHIIQASTPEKTYLRGDYVNLVILTIGLRLMDPIFWTFILETKSEIDNDFKEYYAGLLLSGAKNFVEHPGYIKLYDYLENNLRDVIKDSAKHSLSGLSSDKFPLWALNMIILRRLSIGDVRGIAAKDGSNVHLVTYIHTYMHVRMIGMNKSFDHNQIRDKMESSRKNPHEDDKKISIFEAIRIAENQSPGDLRELEFYFSDPKRIVACLCPDLPDAYLEAALRLAPTVEANDIYDFQVRLLKNLIGPYQPPSCINNLSGVIVTRLLCIMQAIFWYRGAQDIALLFTLSKFPGDDSGSVNGVDVSSKLDQYLPLSREVFPYIPRGTRKDDRSIHNQPPVNIEFVKETTRDLIENSWFRVNLPEGWVYTPSREMKIRPGQYVIPRDIRYQLLELSLRIGAHQYPLHLENWSKPIAPGMHFLNPL